MTIQRLVRNRVGALIAVNAVLLGLLAAVTFLPASHAQFRAGGSYHMVSATSPGVASGVVFIVDETNQSMIAVGYDPNTKVMSGLAGRDIAADIAAASRRRN